MTISMLKEFIALAEHLNYTAAANKLFISQPTLSKHINSMEEELGTALLERTRHGVKLTEAGQRLLTAAGQIAEIYDDAVSDLAFYSAGIHGELKMGVLSHDATNIITPVIQSLARALPTVRISIQTHQPSTALNALRSGAIDVADVFYTDGMAGKSSLSFYPVCSEGFSVLLPRDHHLASREVISLKDLDHERFVWHHSDPALVNYEKKLLKAHKVRVSQEFFADQVDMLPLAVVIHQAVSIVNRRASDLLNQNIIARDIADEDFKVPIAFAWKKSNNNPCLKPFLECLRKYVPQEDNAG